MDLAAPRTLITFAHITTLLVTGFESSKYRLTEGLHFYAEPQLEVNDFRVKLPFQNEFFPLA